jgi:phosphoribosyl 1,2-cyclic phosphodiesterase
MIEICALASGSNGNSYYIGNENEAVLIDAGVYYKKLVERLDEAGLDKSKIKAIFISHEHADHIQGIKGCSKKLSVPGVFSQHTFSKIHKRHQSDLYTFFEAGKPYEIGNIKVFPFKKPHDASDPHSFRIEINGISIGVFTDIGNVNDIFAQEFNKCQAVFLETNYDKEMLWNGSYPYFLKERVDSEIGHLSNEQALELIQKNASDSLHTIFASHISNNNNTEEKVIQTLAVIKDKYNIILTSRHGISEVVRF